MLRVSNDRKRLVCDKLSKLISEWIEPDRVRILLPGYGISLYLDAYEAETLGDFLKAGYPKTKYKIAKVFDELPISVYTSKNSDLTLLNGSDIEEVVEE